MKRVLVPIAPGFEEIEALTIVDILRRAGAEVTLAATIDGPVEGRSGIRVLADVTLDVLDASLFDMIALPGGPGTEKLREDKRLLRILQDAFKDGKPLGAICAAPTVLSKLGLTKGKTITAHPSATKELVDEKLSEDRVVVDGGIITSRAPGTALEFSLKLVEVLFGKETAKRVNQGVLARLD